MKIGVSSYSFARLVREGNLNFHDIPQKAKELGFDCIEFSGLNVPCGKSSLEEAPIIREICHKAGLPIVNYTIGADFINCEGGDWKKEVERLKDEVRVAKILGVKGMRHDATRGFPQNHPSQAKSFEEALPILIKGCRALTEFAEQEGIRTMIENHGFFCQDSERVEKLVCGVNHKNFGVLFDTGNFLCADEDPAKALGRLAPYLFHCHAKDFHFKPGTSFNPGEGWFQSRAGNYLRGAIIGHGDVPLAQCIRLLKKTGYDHVLSIEFEGMEENLTGLRIGLTNIRRLVAEC
jgi:sugar phosphate isomerase/epimerase